jgi:hypothetical protein
VSLVIFRVLTQIVQQIKNVDLHVAKGGELGGITKLNEEINKGQVLTMLSTEMPSQ